MPQGVRPDGFSDPGLAGQAADDPPGAVPVQPPPIRRQEDRSFAAFTDGQVDRPRGPGRQRDGDYLAALAGDDQRPVPALEAHRLNVGTRHFRYPQPVERQQRDQRMLSRRAESGGDQQRAEFVAVQPDRVGFIVQPWPADVRGRGMVEELFFDGIPVEPGNGAQTTGDGGPGTAARFQVTGEALDVGAAGGEQRQLVLLAPGGELPQIEFVGLAGQAAAASQEPGQGEPFSRAEHGCKENQGSRGSCGGHRGTSELG
jgi:hypothetical protein